MAERIVEEGMWVFQSHICFVIGMCVCFGFYILQVFYLG